MTRCFKPRKYVVNRELLERWRNRDRLGIQAIADKYGCDKSTVRNWLKRWDMPTELDPVILPVDGLDAR